MKPGIAIALLVASSSSVLADLSLRGNSFGKLLVASNASCPDQYRKFVGDGWCDSGLDGGVNLNQAACDFDGGDCCRSSCDLAMSHWADRPDDGVFFYCGAAGYHCTDPRYVEIDRNLSSNGTNDGYPQNYTLLVLSESRFTGSALVVNQLQQKKNRRAYGVSSSQREVTHLMEYLFWNALDISAGNIMVAGEASSPPSSTPAPPPKKPPRPPVVPPVAEVVGKTTLLANSQELVTGQRWLIQNIAVQSHLYRRNYAVSEVSWTMAWQTFQYIALEDSDAKGTLDIANGGATASLSAQQQSMQSDGWISADILQRSLRYAASAQSMDLLSMLAVCDSHATNSSSVAHEYSLEMIQQCLSNFSSVADVASESDGLWALYDSPSCVARSSDSWQQYYGTEKYVQWTVAYVVLWMLLLLAAAGYLVNQGASSHSSSGGWWSCLMLSKHSPRHHLLADTASEVPGPTSAAASAAQSGTSRRSLHRRRVLQRVLSFYSVTSFTPNERDRETGGNDDDDAAAAAAAAGRSLPIWTRMWALLRVPGVFSRATVAWLVVATAALRVSHYVWILTPYFKESLSSSHDREAMMEDARSQLVCREFAFSATFTSAEDAWALDEARNGWSRSFLMCLWLVGFHTFFAWSMLAAVARHVHVTVRRAMVRLSLPYLPHTPATAANEHHADHEPVARTQQNPLTRAPLPASATFAGTLAASAMSSESASALSASSSKAPAVAASPMRLPRPVDISHREDADHVAPMDADTHAAIRAAAQHSSQLHSLLVPALLHLQVFHFLVMVLVGVLVATCVLWLAIGVGVQETTLRTAVREDVITVLTASEVSLVYLHWAERIAGGISLIEGVTLLSTMHWLARLYQLVSQHQWRTGQGHDGHLATMASTGQWLLLYLATGLLFLQGALTIVTSHRYFQEATETTTGGSEEGSLAQGRRTFAVYSVALRVVEWVTMLVVAMLLTQPMMTLDGSDAAAAADSSMMHQGGSLTPNGSGFSTPYYSEILGQDGDDLHDENQNKGTERNGLRGSREAAAAAAAAKGTAFDTRGHQYWPSEAGFFGLKRESGGGGGGGEGRGWLWNRLWPLVGAARERGGDAQEGDAAVREEAPSSGPLGEASVWFSSWYERVKSTDGGREDSHEADAAAGERVKNVAVNQTPDGEDGGGGGGGGSVVWTTSALASMATSLWNPAPSNAGQRHHHETAVTGSGHFDDSPPPFVSFHFPQLPKGPDATVVLSDVTSATSSPRTGTDSLRSSFDKSDTVLAARPLYGSKGVAGSWPASLFARRHPRHPHGGLRLHEPLPEADELLLKASHQAVTESTTSTTETLSMRPDIESTVSSLESLPPSPSSMSTAVVATHHAAVPVQL